jgi:hypothetical protein
MIEKDLSAALSRLQAGYLSREDLRDLSVRDALAIVERVQVRMNQLDSISRRIKQPVEAAKQQLANAAKMTAREAREGRIAPRDIRGRVDVNAYEFAREAKAEGRTPSFAVFSKKLVAQIARWNNTDVVRQKLDDMVKAIPQLETQEDRQAADRVVFALELANKRNAKSIKRLSAALRKQATIPDNLLVPHEEN